MTLRDALKGETILEFPTLVLSLQNAAIDGSLVDDPRFPAPAAVLPPAVMRAAAVSATAFTAPPAADPRPPKWRQ